MAWVILRGRLEAAPKGAAFCVLVSLLNHQNRESRPADSQFSNDGAFERFPPPPRFWAERFLALLFEPATKFSAKVGMRRALSLEAAEWPEEKREREKALPAS